MAFWNGVRTMDDALGCAVESSRKEAVVGQHFGCLDGCSVSIGCFLRREV